MSRIGRALPVIAIVWTVMISGFLLMLIASVRGEEAAPGDLTIPAPKPITVLVVAFVGPDTLDKPRHFSEAFGSDNECLHAGAQVRALWQGRGGIGDLRVRCIQFNLASWRRRHS
jgi:hypothetical protein